MVKNVPRGFVTTYKELAERSGSPGSPRAVGNLLAKNNKLVIIPCHRVVKSDGSLGGYVRGTTEKRELLQKEGVEFSSPNKVNLKKCFYNWGD